MDTAVDTHSSTSEHSVASSVANAPETHETTVHIKTECEAMNIANSAAGSTTPNGHATNNNNNNSLLISNNNNISPVHLSAKFSPNFNNNLHAMNTTALLMHHQHQQQAAAAQQQAAVAAAAQHQAAQQQQQNGSQSGPGAAGGRDSTSRCDERSGGRGRGSSCSPASSPTRHPSAVSPVTSLNHSMMQQMAAQQQQQHHQLSPPPHVGGVAGANGLPAGLPPRMPHGLPPHSLGLLNSLQMMHHASPLELMAAAHHHVPPRSYNSPPPISTSDPSANECKLVEYRGQKVAAFIISGDTMLCLPQAFELFLKHLVGGLHTVYTKLKRLDIVPLVCNVEQVRILRGLGAIQPGVNRCKLLACKDFDVLYRDCTTARCLSIKPPESSRPGRPPKRGPVGLSLPPSHLSQHPQLKKHRLENGEYTYENGHMSDMNRLEKSPLLANGYNPPPINHMAFMQMNHHPGSALMSPGMPPHGIHARPESQMLKAAAQSGMSAANMDALARSGIWENCRAAYEDIVKHLERLREERSDERQQMGGSVGSEPKPRDLSSRNCSPSRQSPVLNLSKSGGNTDHGSNCDDRSERSEMHSPGGHSAHEGSLGEPARARSGASHEPIGVDDDDDDNLSDDNVSEVDERMKDDEDLSDAERDNLSTSSPRHLHHHHHHHLHQATGHHPHSAASGLGGERGNGGVGGGNPLGGVGVNERDGGVNAHAAALQQSSPIPPHPSAAAVAALQQHHRALNYSTLAAAAAVANGAAAAAANSAATGASAAAVAAGSGANGPLSGGALTPNEALLANAADASAAAALAGSLALGPLAMDPHGMQSSTETLLRNIQSLLKVAADNARQQERQINYEKAELKMDVLREREVKESLERQLSDERKLRVLYQKRYRRERKMRMRYQEQLDEGGKVKLSAGASVGGSVSGGGSNAGGSCSSSGLSGGGVGGSSSVEEGRNSVSGGSVDSMQCKLVGVIDASRKNAEDNDCKSSEKSEKSINDGCPSAQLQQQQLPAPHQQQQLRQRSESPNFKREPHSDHESHSLGRRSADRLERCDASDRSVGEHGGDRRSSDREDAPTAPISLPPTSQADSNLAAAAAAAAAVAATNGKAPWSYPGIDLMATGAFWQNYSETLAQEIEMERKSRAANAERDVKSPLADRQPAYYKNSVLFGSAN